ncbi:hypothetical protein LINPERPRIM_LOCUS28530, partial [Linum perenne]
MVNHDLFAALNPSDLNMSPKIILNISPDFGYDQVYDEKLEDQSNDDCNDNRTEEGYIGIFHSGGRFVE